MKTLAAKTNVDNTDPNYPNGKSKDNTGANDGTPVDFERLNDFDQYAEQLMARSGITPNGLPDKQDTGYQLPDAMEVIAGGRSKTYPIPPLDATTGTPFTTTIAHGLTAGEFARIADYTVKIIDDAQNEWFDSSIDLSGSGDSCVVSIDATNINLTWSNTGTAVFKNGHFSGATFSSVANDRGIVTIKFLPDLSGY